MAEYIDRNLIEWYGCDFENASCENRECLGCSHAECSHSQVMQIPEADVIERSKVDEAIEYSYKKGLTDAWECARKIGNNSQLGLEEMGFDFSELGTYYNPSWWVVFNYDVFKALEILKRNIEGE